MEYKNMKWLPMPQQVEKNKNDIESLDKRVGTLPGRVASLEGRVRKADISYDSIIEIKPNQVVNNRFKLLKKEPMSIYDISATIDYGYNDRIRGNHKYIAQLGVSLIIELDEDFNQELYIVFEENPTRSVFITVVETKELGGE